MGRVVGPLRVNSGHKRALQVGPNAIGIAPKASAIASQMVRVLGA
jgi:hypothetical protein